MKIINLLPQERQEALRFEKIYNSTLRAVLLAVSILILVFLGQMFTRAYLAYESKIIQTEISSLKQSTSKEENEKLKEVVRYNNALLNDYSKQVEIIPNWSSVVVAIAKAVPSGVVINTLEADLKTREVTINGQADRRESVIDLYNNLVSDKEHFEQVNYPLENVTKPTDVTFYYKFVLTEEALKQ